MMSDELKEKVFEIITSSDSPIPISKIAEDTRMSMASVSRIVANLISDGKVDKVGDGKSNYYQSHDSKRTPEEKSLNDKYAQLDAALTEKVERAEKETQHLYVNMISIMGVFVAIFSLIVINTNAIVGKLSQDESIGCTFLKLLVLNIPVLLCIIALLFGIRFIILRDFKRGDHK